MPIHLALVLAALLSGCAAKETPLPATTKILDGMPRVDNSSHSPCWQQKQIAAQNSYVTTVQRGKEAIYRAPCEVDRVKTASLPASAPPSGVRLTIPSEIKP